MSLEFRRDFRNTATAATIEECYELMGQVSLLDGAAVIEKWFARLEGVRVARGKPSKKRAAAAAQEGAINGG